MSLCRLDFQGTLTRTIVYTVLHITTAFLCAWYLTGTTVGLAAADAIIEPIINSVWYYFLDKWAVSSALKGKT